jgi:hypothetical protein
MADRVVVSVKDEASDLIIKEAKKKCIDENLSFSDAVLLLLDKWTHNQIEIRKEAVK